MGILKALTVSKREANGTYSVLLQRIPSTNQPSLLFENGVIAPLDIEETSQIRKQNTYTKILDGYMCLGVLQLTHGDCTKDILFLVIVTSCVSVGKIQHSEVFRITETEFLPLRNHLGDLHLIQDVRKLFSSSSFYFSCTSNKTLPPLDLTLPAQRAHLTNNTDNRFFWNRALYKHFERYNIDTSQWLIKVLCGGINISTVYIGGQQARAAIISRLSSERAGTRFNVRGVNDNGHVANFVESEQVVFVGNIILSYVIIRGSIPLFWEQPGWQVGSHRIRMSRGSEISQPAYDKHMLSLKERYTNVIIVNLLGSKDSEIVINQLFNAHHKKSIIGQEFPFINFDYHTMCPRGQKDNLEKLYSNHLESVSQEQSFFHMSNGQVKSTQKGVFRVNCLDCLDRTNSFQTFVGLKVLAQMVEMLEKGDFSKILPRFKDVFESAWVQNGDQVSRIYTGTGALEGKSIFKDGTLSVARTIQNNFLDGSKQCAIDVLIGKPLSRDYEYRSSSLLSQNLLLAPPNILVSMCDRYMEYTYPEKIKIAVATWNVNGGKHFDNITYSRARPISDWLVDYRSSTGAPEDSKPIDIYAIGFQEIVDLNASNIVAARSENQRDWLLEIRKTISKNDHQYLLISSVQLVGVCLFVFVRASAAPFVKDVATDQVKTGLGGATGNKGAVAIRLRYKSSSICFICAHFAAGQHQVKERNDNYVEITRQLHFPGGRSINSHDYIFWCGDFNYRLDKITNEDARRAVWKSDIENLLEHDQLKISQKEGHTFVDYIEGEIKFAPTYKYDTNSAEYDSSEKLRIPSWTDRVLFKKRYATHSNESITDPKQILLYNRIELLSSDHRPVICEFEIEVLNVDKEKRTAVFESVLEECGPPDSTVLVYAKESDDGSKIVDMSDNRIIEIVSKFLEEETGEIVLARSVEEKLKITFKNGTTALKALKLNGSKLTESSLVLNIQLAKNDWANVIKNELSLALDNTVNLITGKSPVVVLEVDEDETTQLLDLSIGPQVHELDSICLTSDFSGDDFLSQALDEDGNKANKTGELHDKDAMPPMSTISQVAPKPSRPPPPSNKFIVGQLASKSQIDCNSEVTNYYVSEPDDIQDTSRLDYENQPTPSMPPPPPPPFELTSSDSCQVPPRPLRVAPPPPPLPDRSPK